MARGDDWDQGVKEMGWILVVNALELELCLELEGVCFLYLLSLLQFRLGIGSC